MYMYFLIFACVYGITDSDTLASRQLIAVNVRNIPRKDENRYTRTMHELIIIISVLQGLMYRVVYCVC